MVHQNELTMWKNVRGHNFVQYTRTFSVSGKMQNRGKLSGNDIVCWNAMCGGYCWLHQKRASVEKELKTKGTGMRK
jgi:hypothetical protein